MDEQKNSKLSWGMGWYVIGVGILVVFILIKIGFLYSKLQLEKEFSSCLGVPVAIERLDISTFFPLRLKAFNIQVAKPPGYRGKVAATIMRGDIFTFFSFKKELRFKSTVLLYSPKLNFERDDQKTWNWIQ